MGVANGPSCGTTPVGKLGRAQPLEDLCPGGQTVDAVHEGEGHEGEAEEGQVPQARESRSPVERPLQRKADLAFDLLGGLAGYRVMTWTWVSVGSGNASTVSCRKDTHPSSATTAVAPSTAARFCRQKAIQRSNTRLGAGYPLGSSRDAPVFILQFGVEIPGAKATAHQEEARRLTGVGVNRAAS